MVLQNLHAHSPRSRRLENVALFHPRPDRLSCAPKRWKADPRISPIGFGLRSSCPERVRQLSVGDSAE